MRLWPRKQTQRPPDWTVLATYNGERARGVVHTPEWQEAMAAEQQRFNAWQLQEARRKGWTIIGGET